MFVSQFHESLFPDDSKHKVICIQIYTEESDTYVQTLCEIHDQELAMCCRVCYQMKCVNCPSDDDCRGPSM